MADIRESNEVGSLSSSSTSSSISSSETRIEEYSGADEDNTNVTTLMQQNRVEVRGNWFGQLLCTTIV